MEGENVWLVHRDGFAAGRQLRETEDGEPLPEGRVRVKLDYNGEVVEVDEDDVEKANPPSFDRLEDLAQLRSVIAILIKAGWRMNLVTDRSNFSDQSHIPTRLTQVT